MVGCDIPRVADHVRGYPRRDPGCRANDITDPLLTTDDAHSGHHLVEAGGEAQTILPEHTRWEPSGTRGPSGSPHLLGPTGDRADLQGVTGVMAHARMSACPGTRNPGYCPRGATSDPRAAAIRAWVIADMPERSWLSSSTSSWRQDRTVW